MNMEQAKDAALPSGDGDDKKQHPGSYTPPTPHNLQEDIKKIPDGLSKKARKREIRRLLMREEYGNWTVQKKRKKLMKKTRQNNEQDGDVQSDDSGSDSEEVVPRDDEANKETKPQPADNNPPSILQNTLPRKTIIRNKVLNRCHSGDVQINEGIANGTIPQIVFDMQFEDKMTPREVRSTCCQVQFSYHTLITHGIDTPCRLTLTSLGPLVKGRMKELAGSDNWMMARHDEHYTTLFDREKIVYLTADSPNVIENLEVSKAYIIGGFVDRNRYKNLTLSEAIKHNVAHARLPINLKLKTSKVLTINNVFEILLHKFGGKTWDEAVTAALPTRKIVDNKESKPKQQQDDDGDDGDNDDVKT